MDMQAKTQRAYLILENGMIFEGYSFGAPAGNGVVGEVVFTTAMTGYLETLTDPSYFGQIVVQTFPLIGNYGVIPADFESSRPRLQAYIVRDWCQEPSNFRCEEDLDTFLKKMGVVGLYGIDTRALTRVVREHGVMNGMISTTAHPGDDYLMKIKAYQVENAVPSVSRHEKKTFLPEGEIKRKVVLWDFGAKANIGRELMKRNCQVEEVDATATADEILALEPDGIMLSNGPGDPAENTEIIAQLRRLMRAHIPTFGICLGHQLLALAMGGRTEKMKYGHRGANQPVVRSRDGRVFITSQNHGYAVIGASLPDGAYVTYTGGNDNSCEGIGYRDFPAFSVQFHPEAAGGPMDTAFLFDEFIEMMDAAKASGKGRK